MLEIDPLTRMLEDLAGRASGPMHLRLLLQPTMALIFGIRDGIKDAHEGRPVYFWTLCTQPVRRRELLRSGWKSVGKIFILAVVLDLIYQFFVLHAFHPLQALFVAFVLALVPYTLIRGPVNRLVRSHRRRSTDLRRAA